MELMKKYVAYDVSFVCVMGEKESGKSFFCDKVLNLAEVKGNKVHFIVISVLPEKFTRNVYMVITFH